MAIDIFLKLDGIDGESQDDKHKDEIELSSFSFGSSNFVSRAIGGGGGSGKATFQDFHFVMNTNKASPQIFLSCVSGKHIDSAVLSVRKAGGDQQDYLHYKLSDVLVSSFQTGGLTTAAGSTDQFSLNFAKVETDYTPQDSTGKLQEPVTINWDLQANAAS
jgi:type VI secretion system secreted protein Hcp